MILNYITITLIPALSSGHNSVPAPPLDSPFHADLGGIIFIMIILGVFYTARKGGGNFDFPFLMRTTSSQVDKKTPPTDVSDPSPKPSKPFGLAPEGQGYSVVQASNAKIQYNKLASILASATGLYKFDAMQQLRKCPGNLLVSGLTEQAAQDFVAQLKQENIPALILPDNELIEVKVQQQVRGIEFTPDALLISIVGKADKLVVPYNSLLLLQVGLASSKVHKTEFDTMRSSDGSVQAVGKQVEQTEHHLIADLYARNPSGEVERFRIEARRLNFRELLGDRLQPTSVTNLRLVIEDLLAAAPNLYKGAGVQELLEENRIKSFPHPKDFNGIAEGYLQLIRATELLKSRLAQKQTG